MARGGGFADDDDGSRWVRVGEMTTIHHGAFHNTQYADTTLAVAWDVWEDWDIGKLKKLSLLGKRAGGIPRNDNL
ncbi:hypothetical protein CKAH01_03792 [Colletotrichum kahawae]|uniref:Uncharacterized protein n=1 Tax=Colletotrichum kahawae TaxID=34407 RepID=A0AAD9YQA1_COLKA|nr:hypothetical protein CKAH01_03792 [Colletotrichum kahawae]